MEKVKKKKKAYKNNESFKLQIINDNSGKLHESLGITKDRMAEINLLVKESYGKSHNLSQSLEKVVNEMKHINEAVYATLLIGRYHDQIDVMYMLQKLTDL